MTLPQLGHAVIVNNVAKEMPGSLEDVRALDAAFRKVGFKVEVHNNMTKTVSLTYQGQFLSHGKMVIF